MNSNDKAVFSTRDLTLAAVLITLKFRLEGTDVQYSGTKQTPDLYWKFYETPSLIEARQCYSQGLLQVEPKVFVTNLRSLKAEVVGAYSNPYNRK